MIIKGDREAFLKGRLGGESPASLIALTEEQIPFVQHLHEQAMEFEKCLRRRVNDVIDWYHLSGPRPVDTVYSLQQTLEEEEEECKLSKLDVVVGAHTLIDKDEPARFQDVVRDYYEEKAQKYVKEARSVVRSVLCGGQSPNPKRMARYLYFVYLAEVGELIDACES